MDKSVVVIKINLPASDAYQLGTDFLEESMAKRDSDKPVSLYIYLGADSPMDAAYFGYLFGAGAMQVEAISLSPHQLNKEGDN